MSEMRVDLPPPPLFFGGGGIFLASFPPLNDREPKLFTKWLVFCVNITSMFRHWADPACLFKVDLKTKKVLVSDALGRGLFQCTL